MNDAQPGLFSSLKALPRPAWVLFFGTFLNKFGAFVIPFLTLYLTQHGFTLADAGVAIGAYGLGNLAASILGGWLADHYGRRKTIVLSMFSAAAAMMLLSLAHTLPEIIVLTALTGLTGELYRPASSALLADLVPPSQRVTTYSAYRMAFNAGWAFGPATAGLLVTYGFFWLFAGDALSSALFGLVALFALPKGLRGDAKETGWGEALKTIRRDYRLHQVLLSTLFIALVFFQMASTYGLSVVRLGFTPKIYGLLLSLNGAVVVCCELPLTMFTRRFSARKVMAVGYALGGIGFALNAFARNIPVLAACMAVFTLGEMLAMPVSVAFVADLAPSSMRGRYMGTYSLIWALGLMFGPGIGMILLSIGANALWLGGGTFGLLAALLILREARKPAAAPAYCEASV